MCYYLGSYFLARRSHANRVGGGNLGRTPCADQCRLGRHRSARLLHASSAGYGLPGALYQSALSAERRSRPRKFRVAVAHSAHVQIRCALRALCTPRIARAATTQVEVALLLSYHEGRGCVLVPLPPT